MDAKIIIEDIDEFKDGVSQVNHFDKYRALREIKIIDSFMNYQEPGKYKILISIEKVKTNV